MAISQDQIDLTVAEYKRESADRGTLDGYLEEIARYVLPSFSGHFTGDGIGSMPYAKKTQNIYDATALIALPRFAAVMESMLTPRGTKWHNLAPLESALRKDRSTKMWLGGG